MAVAAAGQVVAGEALAGTLKASLARAAGQNLRTGPEQPARMPCPTWKAGLTEDGKYLYDSCASRRKAQVSPK